MARRLAISIACLATLVGSALVTTAILRNNDRGAAAAAVTVIAEQPTGRAPGPERRRRPSRSRCAPAGGCRASACAPPRGRTSRSSGCCRASGSRFAPSRRRPVASLGPRTEFGSPVVLAVDHRRGVDRLPDAPAAERPARLDPLRPLAHAALLDQVLARGGPLRAPSRDPLREGHGLPLRVTVGGSARRPLWGASRSPTRSPTTPAPITAAARWPSPGTSRTCQRAGSAATAWRSTAPRARSGWLLPRAASAPPTRRCGPCSARSRWGRRCSSPAELRQRRPARPARPRARWPGRRGRRASRGRR